MMPCVADRCLSVNAVTLVTPPSFEPERTYPGKQERDRALLRPLLIRTVSLNGIMFNDSALRVRKLTTYIIHPHFLRNELRKPE